MDFEDVKKQVLKLAQKQEACEPAFKMAEESTDINELADVVYKYKGFCFKTKIYKLIPEEKLNPFFKRAEKSKFVRHG